MPPVPQIARLVVYPIKGCGGVQVNHFEFDRRGPKYDRAWMVARRSDGMMVTQRTHPRLALVRTALGQDFLHVSAVGITSQFGIPLKNSCKADPITVTVHRDACRAQEVSRRASAWCSEFLDEDVMLVRQMDEHRRFVEGWSAEVGFADAYPLLVTSNESLEDLNDRIVDDGGEAVKMNCFRPNIVIDGIGAYSEDVVAGTKVGHHVKLLGGTLCTRCSVTTVDQETGQTGKEPLRTLATYRRRPELGNKVVFGRNFVPESDSEGRVIHVGMDVRPFL